MGSLADNSRHVWLEPEIWTLFHVMSGDGDAIWMWTARELGCATGPPGTEHGAISSGNAGSRSSSVAAETVLADRGFVSASGHVDIVECKAGCG